MTTIRSIRFPLELSGGGLAVSEDSDVVRNAIMHVLTIEPGEYLTLPNYGVPNRLFDSLPDAGAIVRDTEARLRALLLPDYPTLDIRCSGQFGENGLLDLRIDWSISNIPQPAISLRL
ncbi:MAG: hypothetical protein KME10_17920 [Plectolyngbya sp. WJT66-NPBG17]|jgi:hypothetical protein|nr:hypothetical protein [Plectolyngbya sp. WJT66-NPBG17]MBW4525091.1 hypothetical protein [Phormidium tanganyikae FI6-MK23]